MNVRPLPGAPGQEAPYAPSSYPAGSRFSQAWVLRVLVRVCATCLGDAWTSLKKAGPRAHTPDLPPQPHGGRAQKSAF